eukprot:14589175-Ditylum_brightwellii.AAC.1
MHVYLSPASLGNFYPNQKIVYLHYERRCLKLVEGLNGCFYDSIAGKIQTLLHFLHHDRGVNA